jgi:hypothetical protein
MEFVEVEALAQDQVYEFLFIATPLTVRNATGSMMNPIAVIKHYCAYKSLNINNKTDFINNLVFVLARRHTTVSSH